MVPMFYVGDVTVTQTGDSQVEAGDEIEITIEISKKGVSGPARLKLDLTNAQGIEIEEEETEGASFSYNKKSALFIWYSIQPDDKITLKYTIIADADASGKKTITGSFSYLDEDERKTKEIQPFNFSISGDGSVASKPKEEPTIDEYEDEEETVEAVTPAEKTKEEISEVTDNQTENNNQEIVEEKPEPVTEEPEPIIEEQDEEIYSENNQNTIITEDVKCNRNIDKQGNNFIVTININKGSKGGFARVKEEIPTGFKAEKIETEGAIFKFADNSAKFLWSNISKNDKNITIKYKLIPTGNVSGNYSITGAFSAEFLVENDRPKKVAIPASTISVDGDLAVEDNNNQTNYTENNQEEDEEDNTYKETTSNYNNNEEEEEEDRATSISSTTNTNGVKYRVQIIASHNTVSKRFIKKAFGYSGSVNLENHEGWVKYTTDGYNKYKDARNKRNSLDKFDFDGPFVTAYNNGDRITVQEALMISNQSWIQ